jgi:YVTN family beta-propeller protein
MSKFFYHLIAFFLVFLGLEVFAGYAYVVNCGDNTVSFIDINTNTLTANIKVAASHFFVLAIFYNLNRMRSLLNVRQTQAMQILNQPQF